MARGGAGVGKHTAGGQGHGGSGADGGVPLVRCSLLLEQTGEGIAIPEVLGTRHAAGQDYGVGILATLPPQWWCRPGT